jgi:DNA-binding transcriptional LysR family regulator
MELRHLRYFLAVAEHGSFTRAAAELGIQQPPLSAQIHALEVTLGVELFARTRTGSALTTAGEAFAPHAQAAVASAEMAAREAQRAWRGEVGQVVVGFLGSAFDSLLPKILQVFAAKWPDVKIMPIQFSDTSEGIAALRRGRFDFAIARPFLARGSASDDLRVLPLTDDRLNIAVCSAHALAGRAHVEIAALAGEQFIMTPMEERAPRYWHAACAAAGFEPQVAATAQGMTTVTGMVAAAVGIGLVPQSAASSARKDITFIPLVPHVPAPPLALVWRRDTEREPQSRFLRVTRDVTAASLEAITGQQFDRQFAARVRAAADQARASRPAGVRRESHLTPVQL